MNLKCRWFFFSDRSIYPFVRTRLKPWLRTSMDVASFNAFWSPTPQKTPGSDGDDDPWIDGSMAWYHLVMTNIVYTIWLFNIAMENPL